MEINSQLLFFFSALGAFNGVLLSLYFFFFKQLRNKSNYFLGGLFLMLSIRIWKSVFFYFNNDLSKEYLQIGLSACFLIGPFLIAFILSNLKLKKSINRLLSSFLIILSTLIIVVGIIYPYTIREELWGGIFYKTINYIWFISIVLSLYFIKHDFKKIIRSNEKLGFDELLTINVTIGTMVVWAAYFFSYFTSYIVGAISFSFVLYLSLFILFMRKRSNNDQQITTEKYSNKIDPEVVADLIKRIETLLEKEQLFKNPNLTLPEFSEALKERPHLISQLLNDNLSISFTNYINQYRIEEAKRLLIEKNNLKIEAISELCGFNSTSAFYNAFKKVTQTTPSKFIANS